MKSSYPKLNVNEIHSVYIDNLDEWIDVPVYEEKDVEKWVASLDWEGVTLIDYKRLLIENLDLESKVRNRVNSYAIRDEIYEIIVKKNPGLQLKNAVASSFYSEVEVRNVQSWFASGKTKGRPPEVIDGEVK